MATVEYSLEKLEESFAQQGLFRCSKSMLLNLEYVDSFESTMGNRITATLNNEERVIISRHYAKLLRRYLKEEASE